MNKIETHLLKAIKPERVSFSNSIYSYKAELAHFERIDFTLKLFDGVDTKGVLFKNKASKNGFQCKTVVYNHSHGSCMWEGSELIAHCYLNKLNLCLYDSRACGESSESYIYFGFRERVDLLFVLVKLQIVHKLEEFVLWGRSIGCNAILQFFNTIISNEGSFLNLNIDLLNKKRGLNRFNTYLRHTQNLLKKYPDEHNEFVSKHLPVFFANNPVDIADTVDVVRIRVIGIVLDSPYNSFDGFIKDNMKKIMKFISGLISLPVCLYLKNFYKKKLGIDLDTMQNLDLIKKLNLNTSFIVSDKDEMIPYDKFEVLISSFAKKFAKKNECKVYRLSIGHTKKRPKEVLSEVVGCLLERINSKNSYLFMHRTDLAKSLFKAKPKKKSKPVRSENVNINKPAPTPKPPLKQPNQNKIQGYYSRKYIPVRLTNKPTRQKMVQYVSFKNPRTEVEKPSFIDLSKATFSQLTESNCLTDRHNAKNLIIHKTEQSGQVLKRYNSVSQFIKNRPSSKARKPEIFTKNRILLENGLALKNITNFANAIN